MAVENLIFDLDGTLVNSLPGIEHSVDAALAALKMPARAGELRNLIGPPIRKILATVTGTSEDGTLTKLERAFRGSYDAEGWRKTLLYDGVREALEKAQAAGIKMYIATNKPALATAMILEELRIRPFFQDVICRDSVQPPFVSKAAMLESLFARHGIHAGRSLFVGDTHEDSEAGNAVGVKTAIISHGYGGGGSTGHAGDVRIDHFQELPIQ